MVSIFNYWILLPRYEYERQYVNEQAGLCPDTHLLTKAVRVQIEPNGHSLTTSALEQEFPNLSAEQSHLGSFRNFQNSGNTPDFLEEPPQILGKSNGQEALTVKAIQPCLHLSLGIPECACSFGNNSYQTANSWEQLLLWISSLGPNQCLGHGLLHGHQLGKWIINTCWMNMFNLPQSPNL